MRSAGACAAQQTLSAEAAFVLKHSLSLSRRRGHAQVTPLHVAATLLSSRASLLRRACLKSQPHQPSHPLQCRALELCFNVALNRLPATPGPLLHAQPTLSNALVAALKRAQAHQRRGCIEQQQQQHPLIAIKVDLEQLIVSILDDPSVSRVMREAGFSSTAVKNNLEDSSNSVFQCYNTTGGIYSTPSSPPNETLNLNPTSFWQSHFLSYSSHEQNPLLFSPQNRGVVKQSCDLSSLKEDLNVVLEVLLRKKRRNTVIVGDTLSMAEGLVGEFMGKVERGDVPDELKGLNFIKFQFSSVLVKFMKREEVEMNVADLKRKVESFASLGGKVIIYTGDLKWTVESGWDEASDYSPVDHLIAEVGKLISWYESSNFKVWLMVTTNYQTYMKCQMKQPPLDIQWALQSVSVPSGGLGLTLGATSAQDPRIKISQNPSQDLDKKPFCAKEEQDHVLTCCQECKLNYDKEVAIKSTQHKLNKDTETGSAQLPYWLQSHGSLDKDDVAQLSRKYNKMCQNLHQGSHNPNSSSPIISSQGYFGRNYFYSPPNEIWPKKNNIFADPETISFADPAVKLNQSAVPVPRFRRQQSCHIEFSFSNGNSKYQPTEPNLDSLKSMEGKEVKITLALGSSIYSDESKTEKNARSELYDVIRENVPWQSETIPSIIQALIDFEMNGQDKFVLIKGNDLIGKRRFASGVAKSIFGSPELLFCMNMRNNTNKATQNRELLEKALRNHEKLVVLLESVDYADSEFVKYVENGFDTGKLERGSGNAIFILTVDGDTSYDNAGDNMCSVIQMKLVVNESTRGSGTLNADHKRKADWDSPIRIKAQKNNETEQVSLKAFEYENRDFTKKSSSHSLDLNIKADEVTIEQQNLPRFVSKIKNCFVFNRDSDQDEQARGMFTSKLKSAFQEANGSSFDIDEMVLGEIFRSSGVYLNDLFDQWLKDVFQTGLKMVDMEKRDKVSIRLCLDGNGENCAKDGYMGTCLPKRIKVS